MSITAKVICDSISHAGVRITTFELEYPRIIHSELLTHRRFSRNSASSRAIPFAKMAEQLDGKPFSFGKNQSGMQAGGEHNEPVEFFNYGYSYSLTPEMAWEYAKGAALKWSQAFSNAGYHKQVFNRLTEPFQMMKTVVTATEWGNFFWLRNDDAADPTLHELARLMQEAYNESKPNLLQEGAWHLPYIGNGVHLNGEWFFDANNGSSWDSETYCTLEDAIKISSARCAAVSFRNTEYTLEKSISVYNRLVGDERKHSSALEHQATPIPELTTGDVTWAPSWPVGVSHMDADYNLWSGNFKGWIQHRKLIKGENYNETD